MPRDAVTKLRFYVFCSGHDLCAGDSLEYVFRDIVLEQVERPEHEHGWEPPAPCIHPSTVGYWPQGRKTAVGTVKADMFSLVDAETGKAVFSAPVRREKNQRGSFSVLDFSDFTTPGNYYLQAGNQVSCTFSIAQDLAKESLWKVTNFFFCQRCGFPCSLRKLLADVGIWPIEETNLLPISRIFPLCQIENHRPRRPGGFHRGETGM